MVGSPKKTYQMDFLHYTKKVFGLRKLEFLHYTQKKVFGLRKLEWSLLKLAKDCESETLGYPDEDFVETAAAPTLWLHP